MTEGRHQTGNQRIIDFLSKGITLEQIERAVSLCRKHDPQIGGIFMIGSPTETEGEMLNTLSFLRKLNLDRFGFCTYDYAWTEHFPDDDTDLY